MQLDHHYRNPNPNIERPFRDQLPRRVEIDPNSAVEGQVIERGANLPQQRQSVPTSEKAIPVSAARTAQAIEAASQASKKL